MKNLLLCVCLLLAGAVNAQLTVSPPTDPAIRYFHSTKGGKTEYIAESDMDFGGGGGGGVTWGGDEGQVAYGKADGTLDGELAFTYDPVTDYVTAFNFKTLRVNNMETRIQAGTNQPLSFNTIVSGSQVYNFLSHVNSSSGSDETYGIIGYKQFSAGPSTTGEGFFISTRSFGGGPGFGNHTMFISYSGVDMNGRDITGLAAPSADNSAATKLYVDDSIDALRLTAVKDANESKALAGTSTDPDLNITGISAGLYEVKMVLKYQSTDASAGFNWMIFDNNTSDDAVSGYRSIGDTDNLISNWSDFNTESITTADTPHQVEVISGTVFYAANNGRFQVSWGGDPVTLLRTSFIELIPKETNQ